MKPAPLYFTPGLPICDGIHFDDISRLPLEVRNVLCARGLVWLTEFDNEGMSMGGSVIAASREEAEKIADARGLGETVYAAMASTHDWENPDPLTW